MWHAAVHSSTAAAGDSLMPLPHGRAGSSLPRSRSVFPLCIGLAVQPDAAYLCFHADAAQLCLKTLPGAASAATRNPTHLPSHVAGDGLICL